MRNLGWLILLIGAALVACSGGARTSVPFEISSEVDETLAGWQEAGVTCNGPEVGMPGPAASWSCSGRFDGVDVQLGLIADCFGLQSIIASVTATIDRSAAARGFVDLLDATTALAPARSAIATWLLENDAADGTMPTSASTPLGRVTVNTEDDGDIVLYVVPVDSSVMSASPAGCIE